MFKSSLFRPAFMAGALLATSQSAIAAPPIGAGGQLQQIPPAPLPQQSIPDLRIEGSNAASTPGPEDPKVLVQSLHVTGETQFSEAALGRWPRKSQTITTVAVTSSPRPICPLRTTGTITATAPTPTPTPVPIPTPPPVPIVWFSPLEVRTPGEVPLAVLSSGVRMPPIELVENQPVQEEQAALVVAQPVQPEPQPYVPPVYPRRPDRN